MRHEKLVTALTLARALASSAEGMTLDEMALAIGADRRTAERMRDALREVFPQMEEVSEHPRKRFRITGGLDGFMQMPTADELAELHAAAGALDVAGGHVRANMLRTLSFKVESALRSAARHQIAPDLEALIMAEGHALQAGPHPKADADLLAAVRDALKAGTTLCFHYHHDRQRERVVSPWGLLYGRSYYLVGPELGKEREVLWRLDRIMAPRLGDAATPPPPGWSMAAFAARAFGVFQERPRRIVLRFSSAAAPDAARFLFHPTQVLEPQPDGSLIVRLTAGGMLELSHHLFGWGTEVEVLAPDSLREDLRGLLRAALTHHTAQPAADP